VPDLDHAHGVAETSPLSEWLVTGAARLPPRQGSAALVMRW